MGNLPRPRSDDPRLRPWRIWHRGSAWRADPTAYGSLDGALEALRREYPTGKNGLDRLVAVSSINGGPFYTVDGKELPDA